jgi:LuxR family maltose regulon positive regulatory protein
MHRMPLEEIILPTKLNPPCTSDRHVPRPHLFDHLDEAVRQRVTLLSAPAGFGKTTLIAHWLKHRPQRAAWLSLDAQDSRLDRFLRYVTAALHTVEPGLCESVESLLAAPTFPPAEYLADALVVSLVTLTEPLILVLDDYHTLTSEAVQTLMIRLVQQLPEAVHLVILTRIDPPWPLPLWRVRRWLSELRAADLGFSQEETQAFFAQLTDLPLAVETVNLLHRRTGGWIAGLQLAQLSLAAADNLEQSARDFSASGRLIVDFLLDEVLAQQPPDIQTFLVITSLLERFCAPLCDVLLAEVQGPVDSSAFIARLERANLFLVAVDSNHYWYRYYPLFQTLLVQHLQRQVSPAQLAHLHCRAGEWFARMGLIEEALRHMLAAGDVDTAAALVEEHLHAAIDADLTHQTLGHWLDMFPPSAAKQRPVLLMAQAYRRFFNWDSRGVAQVLDQIDALFQDPELSWAETHERFQGDIHVLRAVHFWFRGDVEAALQHARQARHMVPREHRYVYSLAVVFTACAYAASGRRDDALRLLAKALLEDCTAGSRIAGHLLAARMVILSYAGDLAAIQENANQMLAMHETAPIPDYWYGYAHYFLGSVAYERNLLDTAADHFGHVEQIRYRVNTRLYHDNLIGLALVAWARGNADRAREYAGAAWSFAIETNDTYSLHISDSFRIRLAILCGEVPAEPPNLASIPFVDSNRYWLEIPSLTRAAYLVSQATPADCRAGLQDVKEALQRAERHHNTWQTLRFLALKAVALQCAGNLDEALDVLAETLRMAAPLGLVRTFVDRGSIMAELLKALVVRSPENPYARHLLKAFGAAASEAYRHAEADQPAEVLHSGGLSNRELDVLGLLAARLSNKEIAGRLGVSPETVKKHTMNLYHKLHVHGRRQAVAAARQRGLLPAKEATHDLSP